MFPAGEPVKHDFCAEASFDEFESADRTEAGTPAIGASLVNPVIGHKLDVPAGDVSAERYEGTTYFTA